MLWTDICPEAQAYFDWTVPCTHLGESDDTRDAPTTGLQAARIVCDALSRHLSRVSSLSSLDSDMYSSGRGATTTEMQQ